MTIFIDNFINDLASETFGDDVYNEYAPNDANNLIRQANFRLYLAEMEKRKPKYLLVMEAPGYRGCRLTGVPVTSRKILLEGLSELDMFGREKGYQATDDAGFENVHGEQSATIVWGTLANLGIVPLIWNTFPFHPRKVGQERTNRRPRKPEMQIGTHYLQRLIGYFQPEIIIAVGNVAHETLTRMKITSHKVRHPAQGGKNDFVAGVEAIFSGNK
jgi:uracil-DNA glycosylase